MNNVLVIAIVYLLLFTSISYGYAKKSKKTSSENQKQVNVAIPEEKYSVVECMYEEKPAIVVVNSSLRGFKNKEVFGWTCSLSIEYKDLANNGMPTP